MAEQRRDLVRWLLGGGLASSFASFLYPALRFVMPPDIPEAQVSEAPAGKTGDLAAGSAKIVKFGNKPVLLIHVAETEWRAFDAVCTHLNCTVQFQEKTHQIWCACHNALYDLNGHVVSGPPPRPLEEFDVKVRGEDVVISRRV